MASIEEIIGSVQSVIDKLDDAATATQGAVSNCDDAISQAMGLSATSLVGALQAVKATIESGASQVAVAGETFKEAIAQAQAAQDGT